MPVDWMSLVLLATVSGCDCLELLPANQLDYAMQAAPLQLHQRQVRRQRALPAGGWTHTQGCHGGQDCAAPLCAEE